MLVTKNIKQELEGSRARVFYDLFCRAGEMTVHSVENLARQLHVIEFKLRSLK